MIVEVSNKKALESSHRYVVIIASGFERTSSCKITREDVPGKTIYRFVTASYGILRTELETLGNLLEQIETPEDETIAIGQVWLMKYSNYFEFILPLLAKSRRRIAVYEH